MLSPALWREILPQVIALLGPDQSALPAPYKRVNDALVSEIAALLDELRGLGKLRADLDVDYAAFMLNDYGHLQLLRLCRSEPMDLERYWREVRESTAFMVRGCCPPDDVQSASRVRRCTREQVPHPRRAKCACMRPASAVRPVNSSNALTAWNTAMLLPSSVRHPSARAWRSSSVSSGK